MLKTNRNRSHLNTKSTMKKINIFAIAATLFVSNLAAQAQNFTIHKSEVGDSVLNLYKEQCMENMDWMQGYTAQDGTPLKFANATGFGAEAYMGYHFVTGYSTPELGVSVRYDNKKVSYRVSASILSRKYNSEAIEAGKRYLSYAVDGAFHINLYAGGYHENVVSVYGNVGYIYGQHRYYVGEAEIEEGTIATSVKHNGSGVTYGGGVEYRRNFFATGNSLSFRAGYKTLPNTYVNDTRIHGTFYVQVGFTFGIARNRFSAKK